MNISTEGNSNRYVRQTDAPVFEKIGSMTKEETDISSVLHINRDWPVANKWVIISF